MMATAHGIKSLGNRGHKNDEVMYGRTGRPKDRDEHMGIIKGLSL
jgi:hypothetical protein